MKILKEFYLLKIITVLILSTLILLPSNPWSVNAQDFTTSSNTNFYVTVNSWKSASINFSERTNMIENKPINEIRGQIDAIGNQNLYVEDWEVTRYEEVFEIELNRNFTENQGKDTHLSPMMIDGRIGVFNRTLVTFQDILGPVEAITPVIFSIEIFWDYAETKLTNPSHEMKLSLTMFLENEQSTFNQLIISLPEDWSFNFTAIPELIPELFFEKNRILNITGNYYLENFRIEEVLSKDGLVCEPYTIPVNGNGPPNGGDGNGGGENGDDEALLFLSWLELGILITIIVICLVVVIALISKSKTSEKKKDNDKSKKDSKKKSKK